MNTNNILVKNESESNRVAAKVMLVSILFIALVYTLNILKIFIVPIVTMSIAMAVATMLLLVPAIIVFVLRLEGRWIKYVIVSAAALMVSFISMFLSYNVVILYTFAIAIASLYFSRKLSWFAVLLSIFSLSLSQIFVLYAGGIQDSNLPDLFSTIVYAVIPRGIELLALSMIFILLSKRTRSMLENVMGAEEQKEMLGRMLIITNKSHEVSNTLADSVRQLSDITINTTRANEKITENTGNIVSGSENTLKFVDQAVDAASTISDSLNRVAHESKVISDLAQSVNKMTEDNGLIIKKAADEMCAIDEATRGSKEIIFKLGERSNEIGRIVEIIAGISSQTNLLALNAAIESARAGEHGKGFAVVAEEVRKLAEQSNKAAMNIENLIEEVLEDTQKAVQSMDKGSKTVDKGLAAINEVGKSFERVSAASREMSENVRKVSSITVDAAKDGDKIANIVNNIRDINHKSLEELQSIAASSEEQLASMQQVSASVDTIDKIASELLEVVGKA